MYTPITIEISGLVGSGKTLIGHIIAMRLRELSYDVIAPDPQLDQRMLPEGWENNFHAGQKIEIKERVRR